MTSNDFPGAAEELACQPEPPRVPATFFQQRLWFLDQLQPGDASYNIPWSFRLRGNLDTAALERTLNELVRRHEILRTTFALDGQEVAQVIRESLTIPVPMTDLTGRPDAEDEARRIAEQESLKTFDLQQGPLLRARLLRLGGQDHVLLLSLHHIIFDGWSRGILAREISAIYAAFCDGSASPLPETKLQYGDYAVWQHQYLRGKRYEKQLAYWKNHLTGAPATLELPTDHPRPPIQTANGATREFILAPELVARAKEFANENGASLFMVLLAAYGTLLSRLSGQNDIVVGVPTANRTRPELEGLIGPLLSNLALRLNLAGSPTFRELLQRTREMALNAYSHQDMPFEKLVQELSPERSLSHNPLFQVVFSLQNAARDSFQLAGLELSPFGRPLTTAKFDISVFLTQSNSGISGRIEYKTDLFDTGTVERIVRHFQTLLAAAVNQPDQQIGRLPILTEQERDQLLIKWNDTRREYPRMCVHEVFEAQADLTPDAVAVVAGERKLTYRELNAQADRLAGHLRSLGVGPDTTVGIMTERCPEMITGLLGILKAGGGYVPLDPEYPAARLSLLMDDAGVRIVLTRSQLSERIPASVQIVPLDHPAQWTGKNTGERPTPDSLAYVIYTSGSTGQPKGVEVAHRAIVRLVRGANYVDLSSQDVFLQLAPLSFDASTFEIWGALLNGAKLVIYPGQLPTVEELSDVLAKHRVTVLWLTSSLFNYVIDTAPEILRPVRQLLTGGEALSVPHIRRALQALPGTQLINGYGPTENTTFTVCYRIPADLRGDIGSIPLGYPISNTTVYVLDANLQPQPIGVRGELYIGGDGLARGYLKRPELTATKFIVNPHSGERLYATGDLARYLADGRIEFIGRLDDQIKIRGFRIEPGEIEVALAHHPAVRSCAVIVREDEPRVKRLVAYVVANTGQDPTSTELKEFLKQSLPDYMVPGAFVKVASIPLTANGKIDIRALPKPDFTHSDGAQQVLPRDEAEKLVAEVWERLLGVHPVGVTDNFFDIGGHSLLAVALLAEIKKATGTAIPLAALFQGSTVEYLARFVRDEAVTPKEEILIEVHAAGSCPPLFTAVEPGTNSLGYLRLSKHMGPDQPIYTLRRPGEKFTERPYTNDEYEVMAGEYIQAMKTRQPHGPYYLMGMCEGAIISFFMAKQLEAMGDKVALLVSLDAWARENTRSKWRIRYDYYTKRLMLLTKRSSAESWRVISKAVRNRIDWLIHGKPAALRIHDQVYWPDKSFVAPKVDARITLIRAPQQYEGYNADQLLGWGTRTRSGVDVFTVNGKHQSLLREPTVAEVSAVLVKEIARTSVAEAAVRG